MDAKVKKDYEWLIENEDGTYTVKTKKGEYKMKELIDEEVESCTRLSEKTNTSLQKLLATRSIVEPKTSDRDFGSLPSSVSARLKFAAMDINGLTTFL